MSRKTVFVASLFILLVALLFLEGAFSQRSNADTLPFGTADDVVFAQELWLVMEAAGLVGSNAMPLQPFFGGAKPHGRILEITNRRLSVRGHVGDVVIKRNYEGSGVTAAAVTADRERFLTSINVMYRREAGYDEDNQNWFWVKYRPHGKLFQLDTDGRKVDLAGRIQKGKQPSESRGCIFCHRSAGGGDYVFYLQIHLFD